MVGDSTNTSDVAISINKLEPSIVHFFSIVRRRRRHRVTGQPPPGVRRLAAKFPTNLAKVNDTMPDRQNAQ